MIWRRGSIPLVTALVALAISAVSGFAQDRPATEIVDPQKLLDGQTFWDNRDWDWYKQNIPFFECPEAEIQTTYYYRWELLTKHLTYGSPNSGYSFTEFIDRPFWSGAYGAISCPAGHQLYEARWLRDPRIARDYGTYWLRTPGAQPRNYSTWLADSVWAVHQVHPDEALVKSLLPDLKVNHEGWEKRHHVADMGLFWQTGHDDGMEFNINSRQTKDILRGAPSYRPTMNAYMWADALAIARIADLAGDKATAETFRAKAAEIKRLTQEKLWDPKREFFFPMYQRDEEADGHTVKALSLTYQTGRHAGSDKGRELIGYVPWQFNMPDDGKGYEVAWKKLLETDGFAAPFGPTTVERNDPMFLLQKGCCWWSGQSWPYATSQTLKGMANLLQNYRQDVVTSGDYVKLLRTFAVTHRKDGKPYLAEACHPDSGSFEGHDGYNHSEHYFHSSFNDLIITGLIGIQPRDDDQLTIKPLAPADWPYFALTRVPYKGRTIAVVWDRDGGRYKAGKGLTLFADGKPIASSPKLEPITVALPPPVPKQEDVMTEADKGSVLVNFAVNNDGYFYPRATATHTHPQTSLAKAFDGNYWYHRDPPNRWTALDSPNQRDSIVVEFGTPRKIRWAKLYFLDDGKEIVPPEKFEIEIWQNGQWTSAILVSKTPAKPTGRQANTVLMYDLESEKMRVRFKHAEKGKTGLTELELWGYAKLPLPIPPHPPGNLAYNPGDKPFPKATSSYNDRFGGVPKLANDGKVNFLPTPTNRWTSYESPADSDWLEIDFGEEKTCSRVELAIYDDRGGVQPPKSYTVEAWLSGEWKPVANQKNSPEKPTGGQMNEARFDSVKTTKLRVVFVHTGKSRSGVSEIFIWND